jgi:siroheme synthase-like protein
MIAFEEKRIPAPGCSGSKTNQLFPLFVHMERLRLLVIGGNELALEKVLLILLNAPHTAIRIVAEGFSKDLEELSNKYEQVSLVAKTYSSGDLYDTDLVIVTINDQLLAEEIREEAKARKIWVYIPERPTLSDIHFGDIVHKGHLKIAISTNGRSPAVARRLRDTLQECIPVELNDTLEQLHTIKQSMGGELSDKIKKLNELTTVLASSGSTKTQQAELKWKRIASWFLFAFFFMFLGHLILSFIPFNALLTSTADFVQSFDSTFYWMILAGFLAQLVDGLLGMGYGVVSATVLLSLGVKLPAISGSIHTAEMFSSAASGYSHYRFGNVNKKLFKTLLIPGVLGAIAGAFLLTRVGDQYADYIKPVLAFYTFILGVRILRTSFKKDQRPKKVKRVGWLGAAGGFLDSFGGGGWGPLVTSTLISKGRTPKYVIGSVSIAEFFVTLASAATFFSLLGISHWPIIAGLIIGGVLAAPLAAKLAGKLPLKTMFMLVGILVIVWSIRTLLHSLV